MSSNSDQIVHHIRQEFQSLLDYVTNQEDRTAYATATPPPVPCCSSVRPSLTVERSRRAWH
jgi:hypothetical protein